MKRITVEMNSINLVSLDEDFEIIDNGFGPCIILFYLYQTTINNYNLKYIHLDETSKDEFNIILKDITQENVSKVIVLGGRESENLTTYVIKNLRRNKIEIISERFFDFFPITKITLKNSEITVFDNTRNKTLPFINLLNLYNIK